MMQQSDSMFILEEYGDRFDMPDDGWYHKHVSSMDGRGKCRFHDAADWYPRPLPPYALYLFEEWLHIPLRLTPIFHIALWELLKPHWPLAIATPCTSAPGSRLKIGHRYVRLSLPAGYRVDSLLEDSRCHYCNGCGKLCWWGKQHDTDYCVLPQHTSELPAFVCNGDGLIVESSLRCAINKLGIGIIGWRSCSVCDTLKTIQADSLFDLQNKNLL